MDARKGSSLSTVSDGSDSSLNSIMNLVLEQICLISLNQGETEEARAGWARTVSSSGNYISVLCGDSQLYVAELRLRPDTNDCPPIRSTFVELPGTEDKKKYLDCCLFQTGSDVRLALLVERKNKERFVVLVEVMVAGRGLSLGQEMAVYDKASMLGKGLTHITATEADVFTCGSLIRKLRMEEGGGVLKPTTGRVAVPPECVDGTLCLRVISQPTKNSFTIVSSFKTKSAGKNKYQINWFQGRGDEISAPSGKSSLKLSEDQEPSCILSDPRDARAVYLICNSSMDSTAALYKLIKGRKLEEPITTFPFPVTEATLMVGTDKNLFLLVLDPSGPGLKVFHVMKTQGYRGTTATWSRCPELAALSPATQAVSCSGSKWQLSPQLTDAILSPRCHYQLALATLLNINNEIATEPESGAQYRLRALGGDGLNDAITIILDDIERSFEAEEDALSSMTLKICMNSSPGRDGLSLVSGWLMAGRLASVEIYCTRLDNDTFMDSDRLIVQTFPLETFRFLLGI